MLSFVLLLSNVLHNAWCYRWCLFVLFVICVIFVMLVIMMTIIIAKRELLGDSHTHYQHTAGGLLGTAGELLVDCW